ncbi:fused response regulator/phosphatase [Marinobacter zhejiangensis]|uniref:Histidine kinase-like ATPase domain-containing protein n=1 Tax=Marinobacter zhejiangensis TaxID=488535 RepID=A0A1I4NNK4_9GAMM|nr:fused response regulator/phosphatase [Marinobacter zhejiangensis]SFM17071.1 Histidine kinase-like ATPase domain-containing protein [Marinobacter zhejiangensis]
MDDAFPEQGSLRILIADDSDTDRLILSKLVERQGHKPIGAADGDEAVALFCKHDPHIVLLDLIMPRMDGMEAARQIKMLAGENLVPVIFLTSISDARTLAKCLESGGDDFLSKPYNRVILEAKINAFNRMRLMHRTLTQQRDLIRNRNRKLLQEQEVAKRVFDNVAHTGSLNAENLRYHASPLSIFNGDVLFACRRPSGGMHILVGDFTGHGLPAAIGAMPVAEIFYGMTSKGFGCEDVLREINQKLKRILPVGMFCCAAFIQADFSINQLRVWNGGLPNGYLIRGDGRREVLRSRHLPLGVLSPERFSVDAEVISTDPGDVLLVATDGIVEAENAEGDMFGEERLLATLDSVMAPRQVFDAVMGAVGRFASDLRTQDDLTVFALEMTETDESSEMSAGLTLSAVSGATEWLCHYELSDQTLGQFNPLPLLLHICMEVPGLRHRSGEVHTLLSELYTNALEHGILKLPSEWKNTPEGFGRYYAERARRLERIRGQSIRFTLRHSPSRDGGRLVIECHDTGEGFDYQAVLQHDHDPQCRYAGRGLVLLRQLSHSLTFHGNGNRVEVVYDWSFT